MANHNHVTGPNIHTPYRQVFADAAARAADATVYTAADLYKKAYQVDTAQSYTLTAIGPTTWTADAAAASGLIAQGHAYVLANGTISYQTGGILLGVVAGGGGGGDYTLTLRADLLEANTTAQVQAVASFGVAQMAWDTGVLECGWRDGNVTAQPTPIDTAFWIAVFKL